MRQPVQPAAMAGRPGASTSPPFAGPLPAHTHTVATAGTPGWQIKLIAAVAGLVYRAW
jgi:hypothetical protein